MGRKRTPTKVLELRGAFRTHPERKAARENEPEVTRPLGDPPARLTELEAERWRDIADMAPWAAHPDRALVEQTARAWARCLSEEGTSMDERLLASNLAKLGMTPTDRSKVVVPGQAKPKTKFGERRA